MSGRLLLFDCTPTKDAAERRRAAVARCAEELHEQLGALLRGHRLPFLRATRKRQARLPAGWPDYTIFLPGGETLFWQVGILSPLGLEEAARLRELAALGYAVRVISHRYEAQEHLRKEVA